MKRIWRKSKRWIFPATMIGVLILWGILTGWWNMAGLSIVLIVCITVLFKSKARPMRDGLIVLAMIPVINKKIKALERFQNEAEERVIEQVRKNEDFAKFLNTDEQLFQGVDSENNRIRPPYAPLTVRLKIRKRQPVNRVTLRDTGAFYDAMDVIYGRDEFRIINLDEKAGKLRAKYGAAILGLNEDSRFLLAERIKPDLIQDFKISVL